jgi:hypothetical protein
MCWVLVALLAVSFVVAVIAIFLLYKERMKNARLMDVGRHSALFLREEADSSSRVEVKDQLYHRRVMSRLVRAWQGGLYQIDDLQISPTLAREIAAFLHFRQRSDLEPWELVIEDIAFPDVPPESRSTGH